MNHSRPSLPSKQNPFLQNPHVLPVHILASKRCLGQTDLTVKPGQVDTSNATKVENLGLFDYAHLRAPLPRDLTGSEIFISVNGAPTLDYYFLMRRSSDGYISATGMFKAAFPWASKSEEERERAYVQSHGIHQTDPEEVAGNVWIDPHLALHLAKEYQVYDWIVALLDPSPVSHQKSSSSSHRTITSPPTFEMPASVRKRSEARSASPTKMPAPTPDGRAKATPRKRRTKKEQNDESINARAANAALQSVNDILETPSVADSAAEEDDVEEEAVKAVAQVLANGDANDAPLLDNTARITVNTEVQADHDVETTRTSVKIEMPANAPGQPLPESPEETLETAKSIVADARALEVANGIKSSGSKKRKADTIAIEEPEEEVVTELVQTTDSDTPAHNTRHHEEPLAKRSRVMVPAEDFRRQKMQKRALMGLTASVAIGAAIPFISSLF